MASSPPLTAAIQSSVYERLTSGCTRLVAHQMVQTIKSSITSSSYILDNACGPGIVSEQIKLVQPDARILAADLTPSMVEEVQKRIQAYNWTNVGTAVLDSRDLSSLADKTFTHVLSNFGGPIPDDSQGTLKAVKEAFRVLKVGGMLVMSTWAGERISILNVGGKSNITQDRVWPAAYFSTARVVRPHEEPQNGVAMDPEYMTASWLACQLEEGGFRNNVEVKPVLTYVSASSLDVLVENMMLGSRMFFAGYSDEELGKAKSLLGGAMEKTRTFERFEDGRVRVGMKAWIGVGWKKGDEGETPL